MNVNERVSVGYSDWFAHLGHGLALPMRHIKTITINTNIVLLHFVHLCIWLADEKNQRMLYNGIKTEDSNEKWENIDLTSGQSNGGDFIIILTLCTIILFSILSTFSLSYLHVCTFRIKFYDICYCCCYFNSLYKIDVFPWLKRLIRSNIIYLNCIK